MNAPIIHRPDEATFREYFLSELRCASIRSRIITAEIDRIGVILKAGWITPGEAIEELDAAGALDLFQTVPLAMEVPA